MTAASYADRRSAVPSDGEIAEWIALARTGNSGPDALFAGHAMAQRGDGPDQCPFDETEPRLRDSWRCGYELVIPPPPVGTSFVERSLPPSDR